ncbi:MAG: diguanylate cyclase [Proteobacteria bacterium]|nr:diguanylate cyclase [Pseudomonadota bacterium]
MTQQEATDKRFFIEKKSIRRYFYIGSLSSIVILASVLSFIYSKSLNQEFSNKISQLSRSIIEEKKRFIHNAVDRTLFLIEHERKHIRLEYADKNYSDEQLDAIIVDRVSELIRDLRLIDDGYIWVNEIVNYEGGDKYAIRRIHPNLPDTEGMWLSTMATDIKGNKPYEAELNGIKQHGELFYEYYFKKINSDKIAHKMSFAKLYKPYDWVVATGVYLDDVDQLIQEETMKMQQTYDEQRLLTFSIALVVVFLSTVNVVFFEKQIIRLMSNYEQRTSEYTTTLEEISNTDRLTGLFNRLKLDEVLTYEILQAQRYKKVFSILMLDLDRFKSVNDTHGHQIGDQVLVKTSELLKSNSRRTDTVGRWGGEEFLIILPETHSDKAIFIAEKIRQAFAASDFPVVGNVTCSIGVSTFHEQDSLESIIHRADTAMYCAKREGRNKVVCEDIPHSA